MKAVLVATIGTRDLMFQVSSGLWYNIGDDRMRDGDIIGEQAEVISDLNLATISYRNLTHYLLEQVEYRERIKPVIIGKLLAEKAAEIEKVYLIGTDQNLEVRERERDTLYACKLIESWITSNYSHITTEVIFLGHDGTNPANFEEMFRWWQQVWQEKISVQPKQPIWVCLKGGVGQASEAARISGLSLYGDRIQFFEFEQNPKNNQAGICSDYTGPFLGTNYLWDRTQQQALKLLDRYDYAGLDSIDLFQTYLQQDSELSSTANLIKAGLSWNQGEFKNFFECAKSSMNLQQKQQVNSFWWQAYEEAYLAVVRLKQNNTIEAMFHSFRAVEGLTHQWAIDTFPQEVTENDDRYASVNCSICQKYPNLKQSFQKNGQQRDEIELNLWTMQRLVEADIPHTRTSQDLRKFWEKARVERNSLFHRLGGLTQKQVLQAWGNDIRDQSQWETRILKCLNIVAGNKFDSLTQASLFASMHERVKKAIIKYQP